MSDDKSLRGSPDRFRISLSEDYEVAYWTKKLGVDRDRLEAAVAQVGNGVEAVTHHLKRSIFPAN